MTAASSWTPVTAAPPTDRARGDAAVRTGATTAVWLGLTLVAYWWAAGGGVRDLGEWTGGLTSTGRLTGLVASDLLLVQVAAHGPDPVLERAFGQDRLARQHRLVGFTSFNLMLAHIGADHLGLRRGRAARHAGQLWDLDGRLPGHAARRGRHRLPRHGRGHQRQAARRRLRYESWHLLHLYAYLGVGLALPHQLWTGQEFLDSTGAHRLLVGALDRGAPAAVLVWRIGLPVWRSVRHGLRVTSVVPEADGVRVGVHDRPRSGPAAGRGRPVLRLAVPRTAGAGPGPTPTRCRPRRTAAACGSPSRRSATAAPGCATLRPGTRVLVEGPYGRLSARARTRAQGRVDRRRRRRHAAACPGRGTATTRRATPSCCTATAEPAAVRRRVRVLAPGAGPARPEPARAPPGAGSWLGDGVGRPTTSPSCAAGCPTSPSATSTSAAPRPGPPRSCGRALAAGLPRRAPPHRELRVVTPR